MNKNQKAIIIIGILLIILTGIYPPWNYTKNFSNSAGSVISEKPAGYGLIFNPPPPENESVINGVRLDYARLLIQWGIIAIAAFALFLLSKK